MARYPSSKVRAIRNNKAFISRPSGRLHAYGKKQMFWRLAILLLAWVSPTLAQECGNSRPLSTPNDHFFFNNDGTVTELETGLTWMRCSIGQKWNGATCSGEARAFTWQRAVDEKNEIQAHGYAGEHNWRLPQLRELAMIVERECLAPRINLHAFPNTPTGIFWTANRKRGAEGQTYAMDFNRDGIKTLSQNETAYVRLVSGRE